MKKNYLTKMKSTRHVAEDLASRAFKLFGLFMLAVCFNFTFYSQSQQDLTANVIQSSPWVSKGLTNEIIGKRSRTSKHFMSGENKITSYTSPGSMHYMSDENKWEDISVVIETNQGKNASSHPYVALKNSIKTWFPNNPFIGTILMKAHEGNFKERVKAIKLLDANKNVISTLPVSNQIAVTVDNNKITYSGFYPGLSLEYNLGNDKRKFDLIIQSSNFISNLPVNVKYISIEEEFISENQNADFSISNNEITTEINGNAVLKFVQPMAFDSNVSEDEFLKGELSYTKALNSIILQTDFSTAWMQNSSRVFPIHLDPTVDYYPLFTTYWTGYQTSSSSKGSGMIRIATSTTAAWAKFDLSSLPLGCTVTQAVYFGYHYSTTSSNKTCEIRTMGTVDPVPSSASVIYNQITSGAAYNTGFIWGGSTYAWHSGNLNSTGLNDVASAAGGTIALGFKYSSGSTTFMYHYGVNGTSTNICYLEVDYFTVPCSGTPGSNAVVSPSYAICPGTNVNLTLANTYSVGGISYQWQSSTTSSVGPFTAIIGGTNSAITTPTLGTQTWFNAVITCSTGGSPTTATVGVVMVQATTTNSIPYSESFEGINSEDDLPNCSWSSSNLGSTCLTYTSSNTLGRIPRTGNNFASFYYNPGSTNYFYTNGIQLEAGITYSTSLWFQTEYYGYTNWTDLSILIGTNQSSTGLTTIASTNGPAISTVYKSLSDTFSVASSGIYYVCVRGTGNTSSSAQYLSWDDLEIIAPCEYNSPNVSLSASSTTICAGQVVNLIASGADDYTWNTGANANSINEMPDNTTTYVVVATNTLSGCSIQLSETIYVNASPLVYVFADNNFVCSGSPVVLTALGGSQDTYLWSNGGSGASIVANPTIATTYSVLATNAEGCSTQASYPIGVHSLPTILATSPQSNGICEGEFATLNGSGASTYSWITSYNSQLLVGTNVTVAPITTADYTVTGMDINGCENKTTITVLVNTCTGLQNVETNANTYKVYPNPTNAEFNIEFNTNEDRTFVVTDVSGRVVVEIKSNNSKIYMNLSDYADGIYYLRLSGSDAHEVIKVIKTH